MNKASPFKEKLEKASLFSACHWIKKEDKRAKQRNGFSPCRRWGHSAIVHENQMYVFGGAGNNPNTRNWESIYILNCDTYEWEKICPNDPHGINIPEPRDSHSCTKLGNNMYIFGGSNGKSPLNDTFCFNFPTRTWTRVMVSGEIPSPREGHSAVGLNDRYILVFGGWNGKTIFNNFYLFDTEICVWKRLENEIDICGRESHSCSVVKDAVYVFGGQGITVKRKDTYFNDMMKMKIGSPKVLMEKGICKWDKIQPLNNITPPHRTSHSAVVVNDRYIFIIGGEGYHIRNHDSSFTSDDSSKNKSCFPRSDIWIFDTEKFFWQLVEPRNSEIFTPRFTHSCALYKHRFIIFGGLKDYKNSLDELIILELECEDKSGQKSVKSNKDIELCTKCKRIFMVDDDEKEDGINELEKLNESNEENIISLYKSRQGWKHNNSAMIESSHGSNSCPYIALKEIWEIAKMIENPFQAVGILIDNAVLTDSTYLKIDFHPSSYLSISFNGIPYPPEDLLSLFLNLKLDVYNTIDCEQKSLEEREIAQKELDKSYFSLNLKLGSFRLGKKVLFITNTENYSFFGLFDLVGNEILVTGNFFNDGKEVKKIEKTIEKENRKKIEDKIAAFGLKLEQLNENVKETKIIIMDLYESELKSNKKGDDVVYRPFGGVIGKEAKKFKEMPDFSLKKYLELIFLNPDKEKLDLYLQNKKIEHILLRNIDTKESVWKINDEMEQFFLEAKTYPTKTMVPSIEEKEEENKILEENISVQNKYGIMMYYNNRLINRMGPNKFGSLAVFLKRFQAKSFFDYSGYVELNDLLKLNILKTDIEKFQYKYAFEHLYSLSFPKKINTLKRKPSFSLSEEESELKRLKSN